MTRLLISWLAYRNDFLKGGVIDPNGPNASIHTHYLDDYAKHIWLMQWPEGSKKEDLREAHVKSYITKNNLQEKVELIFMQVNDPIDINEVRGKSESIIERYKDYEIDVFISPGTPAMQTAWYFLQLSKDISLFQTRREFDSKAKTPEREYISLHLDKVSANAVIRQESNSDSDNEYLTDTPSLEPIYERAERIAHSNDVTTLILGGSGTGKEHLAKYIHYCSARAKQAFIAVNCSAFGDQLLESRLFGFKKGAFTGANEDTKGVFELATGGTVFLDEIGDISSYMQQSLLRVLQEKEVTRIGEAKPKKIDVRIVAATNRDLISMCKKGEFRWDLYYRLAIAELELPTLAERGRHELERMVMHFLKTKKKKFDQAKRLKVEKHAMQAILAYPFPGNIRELENLIERLYVFCEDKVELRDLPKRILEKDEEHSWKWQSADKAHLKKALEFFNWNKKKVAEEVGLSYNTLQKRIADYDLKEYSK